MPTWEIENTCSGVVCGIDEAGRGPWVGPVVAGAVIFLDRNVAPELLQNLNDSKKLSAAKREKLYDLLLKEEKNGKICCGIGLASAQEIDELNILQSTFLAMSRAAEKLRIKPQFALIDGNRLPAHFLCPTGCYISGDARSYSIAAASILAKVYRDRLLQDLARKYPYYGFEKNAGYGTKDHIAGIREHGLISEHRKSYKPIKNFMETGQI
jgi:ribonuclease HII